TLAMENEIMTAILEDEQEPQQAATAWLQANPSILEGWLDGVTTLSGDDGLAAVNASLGL
ncbi:MAG: glycine/betaine ABC transporter substrate-binding protein, partial [Rhodospirillales bacterium]|nr:glycine/betaine ABC transporter substrate-binding protein [Rhodospirillales bacterium]